jgi:hypothetical protein
MMMTMRWSLVFITCFLQFISAREQHQFSLGSHQRITINPRYSQPWSLSISQNPLNLKCLVLSAPTQAQAHKWIQEPDDVLVLNKTLGAGVAAEKVDEYLLEIIGYDNRILWEEARRLCAAIEYMDSPEIDTYAEFEVVCS